MEAVLAPGDWEELIAAFREHKLISGEIKPSTWHRVYRHHMNHVLGSVAMTAPPQNAKQLLETLEPRLGEDWEPPQDRGGGRGAIACLERHHNAVGGGAHPRVGASHCGCPLAPGGTLPNPGAAADAAWSGRWLDGALPDESTALEGVTA